MQKKFVNLRISVSSIIFLKFVDVLKICFLGDKRRRRKSWRDKRPRVCFTWRPPLTASALLAPSSFQRKTRTAEPEISTTHRKYFWYSNIGLGIEQTYHQRDVLFICVLRRPEVNIHRHIWRFLSWGLITKRLWQRVWKKIFEFFKVKYHSNDEIVVYVLRIQYIVVLTEFILRQYSSV